MAWNFLTIRVIVSFSRRLCCMEFVRFFVWYQII